jgi:hypothetical protein
VYYVLIFCVIHTYMNSLIRRKNENNTSLCVNIINLHSTVREEEVHGLNLDCLIFVSLQITIFEYCKFLFICF